MPYTPLSGSSLLEQLYPEAYAAAGARLDVALGWAPRIRFWLSTRQVPDTHGGPSSRYLEPSYVVAPADPSPARKRLWPAHVATDCLPRKEEP